MHQDRQHLCYPQHPNPGKLLCETHLRHQATDRPSQEHEQIIAVKPQIMEQDGKLTERCLFSEKIIHFPPSLPQLLGRKKTEKIYKHFKMLLCLLEKENIRS